MLRTVSPELTIPSASPFFHSAHRLVDVCGELAVALQIALIV